MVGLEALRQLVVLQGDEQEDSCSTDAPHEPTSVFISEIEFQHVMFVYESQAGPPKSPSANSSKLGSQTFTLQDVSFRLQRGRGTALLGSSGCGKSTILSLLMHLYSPSSGQILMLDEAGACCRAEDLYRQLAYLPQEPDMFTETIAYNVAMGNDAVAPTEIERVCRLVGLHDEIVALPAGYKTVYRQGVLSGGQRQRLGFARVLLRDAPIVILDEPTSALDAVNEEIMNYVILKLLHDPNKVVLLITHRMKLAQLAPQILSIRRRGAISTVVEAALFIPSDSPTAMTPRSIRRMTCKAVSGGMVGEAPRPTQVRWTEVIAAAKRHYVATSLACCGALLITLHQPAYGYILARVTGLYADPHVDDSFVAEGCGLGGYMMLAGLCAGIGCTLQGWFCRVGEAAANAFKMNIFRRALQSDSYFFHRYSIAALVQLLGTESSDVRYLLTPTVGGVITIFTAVLAAFAISLWTQWKLGLVALAVMPLVVLLGLWDDSAVDPRISSVDAERTVVLYETLSAVRTVKLSRLEAHRQKLCDGFFLREFRRSRSQIAVHSVAVGFSVFVWFSVYSLLFWYGTKLLVHGETNFTDIMIILNCTFRCGMAIGIAIGTISTFRSGKNCLVRMLACLDTLQATTPPEDESLQVVASPSCKTQPVRSASFAVNSLTYCVVSKGERVPVLLNVSCQLPPGQVAIIGSSGSGKSTLLTVLAGLDTTMYDGTVRILDSETGGIVSSDPRSRLWRSLIGYVPQQAALLDGTVEENITYCSDMCGKQAAEEDVKWMMECARLACIHDEIMCMEGGYQSVVGHIGRSLSGGQRERIALARALFKRPALLLLDEAYSSLDPATSAAVAENLAKYCKDAGVTTVSVMHDLEAASKYEYVVVLGRRGIARMGRPEEVEAEALAEEQLAEDKPAQCRQTTSSPRFYSGALQHNSETTPQAEEKPPLSHSAPRFYSGALQHNSETTPQADEKPPLSHKTTCAPRFYSDVLQHNSETTPQADEKPPLSHKTTCAPRFYSDVLQHSSETTPQADEKPPLSHKTTCAPRFYRGALQHNSETTPQADEKPPLSHKTTCAPRFFSDVLQHNSESRDDFDCEAEVE